MKLKGRSFLSLLDYSKEEIEYVKQELEKRNYEFSVVEGWAKGGEGAKDIAEKIVKISEQKTELKFAYDTEKSIKEKTLELAQKIYGAENVEYSQEAEESIKKIEDLGYGKLPICVAKTQYSFSDDDKNLLCDEPFNIHIKDAIIKSGAGFIVLLAGKIMTMPGLPKVPAAESIDFDEYSEITGIF